MATETVTKKDEKVAATPEPQFTKAQQTKLDKAATDLRNKVGQYVEKYLSTRELVAQIAVVLWTARCTFYAPQSSNKNAKGYAPMGTLLPDLGGRSEGYRAWIKENVTDLIAGKVSDEAEAERIQRNLIRYAIQEKVKAEGASDKDVRKTLVLLSLETARQSDRQTKAKEDQDARNRANNGANGLVNETLVSAANSFGAELVKDGQGQGQPIVPLADLVAAVTSYTMALHERATDETIERMALNEAKRMQSLLANASEMLQTIAVKVDARIGAASKKVAA